MTRIKSKQSIWKKVLHEIYIAFPTLYTRGVPGTLPSNDHPLCKAIEEEWDDVNHVIIYLHQRGLIESLTNWYITADGIEVATNNEQIESEKRIQIWIMGAVIFSAIAMAISATCCILGMIK